jgi:hypothetical protein
MKGALSDKVIVEAAGGKKLLVDPQQLVTNNDSHVEKIEFEHTHNSAKDIIMEQKLTNEISNFLRLIIATIALLLAYYAINLVDNSDNFYFAFF